MNQEYVISTNLSSVGYQNSILEIGFKSGGIYQYRGVSEHTYHELMRAASKGQYFSTYIKDKYATQRIQ